MMLTLSCYFPDSLPQTPPPYLFSLFLPDPLSGMDEPSYQLHRGAMCVLFTEKNSFFMALFFSTV